MATRRVVGRKSQSSMEHPIASCTVHACGSTYNTATSAETDATFADTMRALTYLTRYSVTTLEMCVFVRCLMTDCLECYSLANAYIDIGLGWGLNINICCVWFYCWMCQWHNFAQKTITIWCSYDKNGIHLDRRESAVEQGWVGSGWVGLNRVRTVILSRGLGWVTKIGWLQTVPD